MDAATLFRDVRAIVFELDGTLVLTDRLNYTSYRAALGQWGRELEWEYFEQIAGQPRRELCKQILQQAKLTVPWTELADAQRREHAELIQTTRIPLSAPAVRFLRALPRPRFLTGLVSAAPMDRVELLLNHSGLNRFFDLVVSGGDLPKPPSPDLYQSAIEMAGVTPWQFVAIESTAAGVAGAVRAGARVVAAPAESTKHQDFSQAHIRVNKLDYLIPYVQEAGADDVL